MSSLLHFVSIAHTSKFHVLNLRRRILPIENDIFVNNFHLRKLVFESYSNSHSFYYCQFIQNESCKIEQNQKENSWVEGGGHYSTYLGKMHLKEREQTLEMT